MIELAAQTASISREAGATGSPTPASLPSHVIRVIAVLVALAASVDRGAAQIPGQSRPFGSTSGA